MHLFLAGKLQIWETGNDSGTLLADFEPGDILIKLILMKERCISGSYESKAWIFLAKPMKVAMNIRFLSLDSSQVGMIF